MRPMILLCVFLFISTITFGQSSTQWYQTEYYSQGADHFVLGNGLDNTVQKTGKLKSALLNFSSFMIN